jgi:hypothetical protein
MNKNDKTRLIIITKFCGLQVVPIGLGRVDLYVDNTSQLKNYPNVQNCQLFRFNCKLIYLS